MRYLGRRFRSETSLVRRRLCRAQDRTAIRVLFRAEDRRELGRVPRQRLAPDGQRSKAFEVHSRYDSRHYCIRFPLPYMVRRCVPQPLALRGVPFGTPGRSNRPGVAPRTGRTFCRREGQIRADFGSATPSAGALGDPSVAVVSAPTNFTYGSVPDDAGDARPATRFWLSVWANTRYDGDRRSRRNLTRDRPK